MQILQNFGFSLVLQFFPSRKSETRPFIFQAFAPLSYMDVKFVVSFEPGDMIFSSKGEQLLFSFFLLPQLFSPGLSNLRGSYLKFKRIRS
jgi:hypothetical protein